MIGRWYSRQPLTNHKLVDKRYLWLVNGCLEYHRPIVTNPCPPKRSQKSLHQKLVPILPRVSEVGNSHQKRPNGIPKTGPQCNSRLNWLSFKGNIKNGLLKNTYCNFNFSRPKTLFQLVQNESSYGNFLCISLFSELFTFIAKRLRILTI